MKLLCAVLLSAVAMFPAGAQSVLGVDDPSRLTEGRWSYALRFHFQDETRDVGTRTVAVEDTVVDGEPAWLISERTTTAGLATVDSLFVARGDLAPVRRTLSIGDSRMTNRFTGDSVVGTITSPGGQRPLGAAYRPGVIATGAALEQLLRLAPLGAGWTANAELLLIGPAGAKALPLALRVVGQETVTVPAGTFPAWVVEVRSALGEQRLWIDRRTQQVVRLTQAAPQMPGATVETVLIEPRRK